MNSNWKPGQSSKSKGRASAALDDALGDLLGDDDSFKLDSTQPRKATAKPTGGKMKANAKDDDFYSSLAADADVSELSISEADPNEMAKSLAGFDDMEADLFGSKKSSDGKNGKNVAPATGRPASPSRKSTPPKGALRPSTAPESTVKKTVTFSPPHTPPRTADSEDVKSRSKVNNIRDDVRAKVEKKKIDFGEMDEDDPLAGLLSDDDDDSLGIKKKPAKKSTPMKTEPVKTEKPSSPRAQTEAVKEKKEPGPGARSRMLEIERPPTRSGQNLDDFLSSGSDAKGPGARSRMLEIERPPTRSGQNLDDFLSSGSDAKEASKAPTPVKKPPPARRKEAEITFDDDDDDVLGGLGFDDEAPKPKKKVEEEENKPARSIMDSLLGKSTDVSKHLETPGSGGSGRKEFVLDKKYVKKDDKSKEKEPSEDDFLFGGYRPSSAPSRTGQGRRATPKIDPEPEFQPSGLGDDSDRPVTRRGVMSATVDGTENWLTKALKESEPTAKQEETSKKAAAKPASKGTAEPGDWLGLGEKGKEEKNAGDWLGLGKDKHESRNETKESGASDWLGQSSGSSASQGKKESKKTDKDNDWLGLGEEVKMETSIPLEDTPPIKAQTLNNDSMSPDVGMPPYSPPQGPSQRRNRLAEIDLFSMPAAGNEGSPPSSWDNAPGIGAAGGRRATRSRRLSTERRRSASVDLGDGRPLTAEFGQEIFPTFDQSPKVDDTSAVSAQLREMELQQAALKKKQEVLLKQQQQEQKKMQEQQLLAQKKQREVLEKQMREQQAKLHAEQESLKLQMMQSPAVGLGSTSFGSPMLSSTMALTNQVELEGQVKKMELEKEFLQSMLDTVKKRHQEEIEVMESANKSRMQMMEESFQRRELRLREDNDHLVSLNLSKVREMEQERADLINTHHRKLQEWEKDKAQDFERLKDIHRKGVADLRKEHEEAMERLRAARDQEIIAVTNVQSHSKSLQNVMDKIENQARNLGDLHYKVEGQHHSNLDDRERVIQEKDNHSKVLEDRLKKQQEDNDRERTRLQELITKMEMQLREQTRQVDEERWKVKQEQNKLESLQTQVEEEKRLLADQAARDRIGMQKSKDSLLAEQKLIMSQLYEERRALAEERTEFSIQQKLWMEKKEKEAVLMLQAEAEREGTLKTLAEERAQMAARFAELKKEEERVGAAASSLEKGRRDVHEERDRIHDHALGLKKRSEEIEEMAVSAAKARDEGQEALITAKKVESEQTARLHAIQTQLQALRIKEKQMAQERLSLSKDKRDVENARNSMLCMNCRTPVRDSGPHPNQGVIQPYHAPHPMSVQSQNKGQVISATIELDKNYRLWKIDAERDKDFLDDETAFLEALKHTPYHNPMKAS